MRLKFLCVALCAAWISVSDCARILGVFPYSGKSHAIMINTILSELIERGHTLDVMTAFPLPANTPNYTAIEVLPAVDTWSKVIEELNTPDIFELHDMTFWHTKEMLRIIGTTYTEYALQHPNVQRILHANDLHYDLILTEQFMQEAFLMLGHKFKAPIISISTFGWNSYFDYILGSFGAWAHVPHELLPVSRTLNFWQRIQNVWYCLYDKYTRYYVYMPLQQALADKYFAHLPGPHPTLNELTRSISLMIQNTHTPMRVVKPNVPAVIDVGGLHIRPPKPLPLDLQQFLDEASDGVIYFSFGTQVSIATMPPAQLAAFLQVFREFANVKVLLKWNSDAVDNLPANVLPKKWLPQNDLLAHPNVKLFITHGGLLGSQEGVHYGVPMLGIPFYAGQHQTIGNGALAGYALKMQFNNITVESLRWALNELLYNPVYAERAKQCSRIFRDRPDRPLARAIYWIEYVLRFGGAEHLRSAGGDLPWYSYLLLDIVAALVLAVSLTLFCVWHVVKRIVYKKCSAKVTRCGSVKKEQ